MGYFVGLGYGVDCTIRGWYGGNVPEKELHKVTRYNVHLLFESCGVPRQFDLLHINMEDQYVLHFILEKYNIKKIICDYEKSNTYIENITDAWDYYTHHGTSFLTWKLICLHHGYILTKKNEKTLTFIKHLNGGGFYHT